MGLYLGLLFIVGSILLTQLILWWFSIHWAPLPSALFLYWCISRQGSSGRPPPFAAGASYTSLPGAWFCWHLLSRQLLRGDMVCTCTSSLVWGKLQYWQHGGQRLVTGRPAPAALWLASYVFLLALFPYLYMQVGWWASACHRMAVASHQVTFWYLVGFCALQFQAGVAAWGFASLYFAVFLGCARVTASLGSNGPRPVTGRPSPI